MSTDSSKAAYVVRQPIIKSEQSPSEPTHMIKWHISFKSFSSDSAPRVIHEKKYKNWQ